MECAICKKEHNGNKKVCRICIKKYRPKLVWFYFFVFTIFLLIIPDIIYYFYIKNKQEQWDKENL